MSYTRKKSRPKLCIKKGDILLNSNPMTLEDIQNLLEKLEPKTVYVNKNTYEKLLDLLDFEPTNVVVNNFLEDNQALILNETQKKNMNKGYLPITNVW